MNLKKIANCDKHGAVYLGDREVFRAIPKEHVENRLNLIVGGSDEAPLFIHANADIYAGKIKAKKELNHKLKRSGYVLASFGVFEVNGIKLKKGDALEITDADELKITTQEESELLVIDV